MDLPFIFKLVRADGGVFSVTIPADDFIIHAAFLNFFCALPPYRWIGYSSHHKCFVCTPELKAGVTELCSAHEASLTGIMELADFVNEADDNEKLVFLRVGSIHHVDEGLIRESIKMLNVIALEDCYDVCHYGDSEHFFGHRRYSDRKCRFCGQTHPAVKFKDKNAHAIPDSLGNKLLFCYDECMTCNGKLSSVEKQLIDYLDYRRSEGRILNKKNKIVTATGHNFIYDGTRQKLYITPFAIVDETGDEYRLKLESAIPITHLGIYRALCKIAICCQEDGMVVSDFKRTIEFINGDFIPASVPDVWFVYRQSKSSQPRISIYTRRSDVDPGRCPRCLVRLDIIDLTFVYVLPFATSDDGRYTCNEESNSHIRHLMTTVEGFCAESINMADRVGKFSHVYTKVPKSECEIIDPKRLERAQEKPHNAIEFPPFDPENVSAISFRSSSVNPTADVSLLEPSRLETSKIDSSIGVRIINQNTVRVRSKFTVARLMTDERLLSAEALADVVVNRPEDVLSVVHREISSPLVEHVINVFCDRLKKQLASDMPSFDFDRLPSYLMELDGCITRIDPNAEQTIMFKDGHPKA